MSAPTYDIRTVADFLTVPEDRLGECLREFRLMLDMARASMDLCTAIADEMAREGAVSFKPGDVRFKMVDRFEWTDDNLGNATMRILTSEEAAKESAPAPTEKAAGAHAEKTSVLVEKKGEGA